MFGKLENLNLTKFYTTSTQSENGKNIEYIQVKIESVDNRTTETWFIFVITFEHVK